MLGDGILSGIVSNGIGSRFGVFTTALLTIPNAMKALSIPASRQSMRERMRSISATVSNLRSRIGAPLCLTAASLFTLGFIAALALACAPAIIITAMAAAAALAITPTAKEGGEA